MDNQTTHTKRFSLFQFKNSQKVQETQSEVQTDAPAKRPVGRPRRSLKEGENPSTHTSVAIESVQLEKIRYISRIQGISIREVMHQLLGHSIRYYEKRHGEIVVQLPSKNPDKSIFD